MEGDETCDSSIMSDADSEQDIDSADDEAPGKKNNEQFIHLNTSFRFDAVHRLRMDKQ
jgi:hypothetical protein